MKRKTISKKLRFEVFSRDNFICQYCGRTPAEDNVILQVDHLISIKDGGENNIENLLTSCRDCNVGKGKKSINKKTKSEENVEQELKDVKDRLEQLRKMNKKRVEVRKYELEISLEKMQWIIDIIGDNYNQHFLSKIQKIKDSDEYEKEQIEKALRITQGKEDYLKLETIDKWINYFNGVLKNLSLPEEENEILRIYNKEIFVNTPMYKQVKKCILDHSKFGIDFHQTVIESIKEFQKNKHGTTYQTRDGVWDYIKRKNFTVYKNGYNLQVLVCDTIFLELENLNKF